MAALATKKLFGQVAFSDPQAKVSPYILALQPLFILQSSFT